MNVTENSVCEDGCLCCGETDLIPQHMKGKWVCEDCVEKKQREYEDELESESGCC